MHTKYSPTISSIQGNTEALNIRRQTGKDQVEAIPSSNDIDSAMYERDKQIYKCSTLRQGGKFDIKHKPAILNCPLPDIPKLSDNTTNENVTEEPIKNICYTRTIQRGTKLLGLKPIQPPIIRTPSNNAPTNVENKAHDDTEFQQTKQETVCNISVSPKSVDPIQTTSLQMNSTRNNEVCNNTDETPHNMVINPNDESNYAVTEL